MQVIVNGVAISDEAIDREAAHHGDAESPHAAAACALAIRELLLQRAKATATAEDAFSSEAGCERAIERLLEREAPVPTPTTAECHRFYEQHCDRFTTGERVHALHSLLAVTPTAPVEAIRVQAEATLKQLVADPSRFEDTARRFSNCPSGKEGGNLGEIRRGEMVPEFERAVFGASEGILPTLVNTRYGFHIVRVDRHVAGETLDFDSVRERIAVMLAERVRAKATEQYVRVLAAKASISGIDLGAAGTPLVR
ncbi:MAG: peptidylprolyl isomerase [Burkholderiales bacterium]